VAAVDEAHSSYVALVVAAAVERHSLDAAASFRHHTILRARRVHRQQLLGWKLSQLLLYPVLGATAGTDDGAVTAPCELHLTAAAC
jgi:hypothetical protein